MKPSKPQVNNAERNSEQKDKHNNEYSDASQMKNEQSHANDEINLLPDDIWQEMSQDWQAQETKKSDIKALIKRTKKRTFWAKFYFGLNILATVWMLSEFIWGLFNEQLGEPFNTFMGLGGFFSVIFVYYEYKIRRRPWSSESDGPEQAINHAIRGCHSSLRYISLTLWSSLPFGLIGNWFGYTVAKQEGLPLWAAFLYVNFILVSLIVGCLVFRHKRIKELKQLQQLKSTD